MTWDEVKFRVFCQGGLLVGIVMFALGIFGIKTHTLLSVIDIIVACIIIVLAVKKGIPFLKRYWR